MTLHCTYSTYTIYYYYPSTARRKQQRDFSRKKTPWFTLSAAIPDCESDILLDHKHTGSNYLEENQCLAPGFSHKSQGKFLPIFLLLKSANGRNGILVFQCSKRLVYRGSQHAWTHLLTVSSLLGSFPPFLLSRPAWPEASSKTSWSAYRVCWTLNLSNHRAASTLPLPCCKLRWSWLSCVCNYLPVTDCTYWRHASCYWILDFPPQWWLFLSRALWIFIQMETDNWMKHWEVESGLR